MNINKILEHKENCFGCNACSNICPTEAIKMIADEEGFLYPQINSEKCNECGLCYKTCPCVNNSDKFINNTNKPSCYALTANDEILSKSSSGGAFSLFANWILEQGGYVCAAAYDSKGMVEHIIINNSEDLDKLRGSKYVQSDMNTIHRQIKILLKDNKKVLFCGTPCQVAGLNNFIGKDKNLYTIDLICHGVPTPKAFEIYLKETIGEDFFLDTNFREKILPWENLHIITKTKSGKEYSKLCYKDDFFQAFLNNIYLRPSCGYCPYAEIKRQGDLTIGDFWGIEKIDTKIYNPKGNSIVLLNNKLGEKLFNSIKRKATNYKKFSLKTALDGNLTLRESFKHHPNRKAFFRLINQGKSFKEAVDYCTKNKYDCALMGVWAYKNYGASLTVYALQEAVKGLGYIPKVVNFYDPEKAQYPGSFSESFANKYLDLTEPKEKIKDLHSLNWETQTFIVGSDCQWNPSFMERELIQFLSFCSPEKKKISYATSFGSYDIEYTPQDEYQIRYYLQKFDKISVREKEAVEFCKNRFNVEAYHCIDPVFLQDKTFYEQMGENSKLNMKEKFILDYKLFKNSSKTQILNEYLSDKFNLNVFSISHEDSFKVEDWLYLIKNCELLVTHSFHGMCFALIFNKPFVVYEVPNFDKQRYSSVLSTFGLENRLLTSLDDINNKPEILEPINWNSVNSILQDEKNRCIKWLKEALEAEKDFSKIKSEDAFFKLFRDKIALLESKIIDKDQLKDIINDKKIRKKFLQYKILKNITIGKIKTIFEKKYNIYKEKIINNNKFIN